MELSASRKTAMRQRSDRRVGGSALFVAFTLVQLWGFPELTNVIASDVEGAHVENTDPGKEYCENNATNATFAGLTIQILTHSWSEGHKDFLHTVSEWENLTGVKVIAANASNSAELDRMTREDLTSGENVYAGYVTSNRNMPSLAQLQDPKTKNGSALLNMDAFIQNSAMLNWLGVHNVFREQMCRYNGHVYTLPMDGDEFLLYYRRDLQERDGWEVPKTWFDLVQIAEQYENKDLNGDGEPDYAMCQPNRGHLTFHSLFAPLVSLLQTHPYDHIDVDNQVFPKRYGAFFNLTSDGLEPLVNNAAMRRVLPLMQRIYELGRREKLNMCCGTKADGEKFNSGHGLFKAGRCAFYFSFPSVGTHSPNVTKDDNTLFSPYIHGRMGTAELPGWTEYLDRNTDTLRSCTVSECPESVPLDLEGHTVTKNPCTLITGGVRLNHATWFANGGWSNVVNNQVDIIQKTAAFSLFSYVSRHIDTTRAEIPYNPYRYPLHFDVAKYVAAGWDELDASGYLTAALASVQNPNAVLDLRTPYALTSKDNLSPGFFNLYVNRFMEYYEAMDAEVADKNATMKKVIKGLDSDIRKWIQAHDTRTGSENDWTGLVEEIYRHSLGIPLRRQPLTIRTLQGTRAIGWLMATIIIVFSVIFSAWVVRYQKTRVVKASQPFFLLVINLGTLIMGISLFPLGIDESIASKQGCNIACMAVPWLMATGFCFSFAALYCKISRINKIFQTARFQRVVVTEKDVIAPFVTLYTLNVIFLLTWTLVDPFTWQYISFDSESEMGACKAKHNNVVGIVFRSLCIAVNLFALVLANYQAYKARFISDEFSESKYIGIAMGLTFQALLFTFPITFLVEDNPSASFFVYSGLIFVISVSLMLLIFVPKILLMRKDAQKRKDQEPRPPEVVDAEVVAEVMEDEGIRAVSLKNMVDVPSKSISSASTRRSILEADVDVVSIFSKAGGISGEVSRESSFYGNMQGGHHNAHALRDIRDDLQARNGSHTASVAGHDIISGLRQSSLSRIEESVRSNPSDSQLEESMRTYPTADSQQHEKSVSARTL